MRSMRTQQLQPAQLVEEAIRRNEGVLLSNGALCAETGQFTGRSPKDKYFVSSPGFSAPPDMHRWLSEEVFESLLQRAILHLENTGAYQFDAIVNQHPKYAVPIRFYTEFAWHNLFVQNLFLPGQPDAEPVYTVYGVPNVKANPETDGTQSSTFIVIHPGKRIVLIGGTEYAGELKKSIFTLMHHDLVSRDVLPMHCSASLGQHGDVALFFGLSGTGKTTLSAHPERSLIGDDEHGWGDDGVFNMENGCYAKCIGLSEEKEPDIYRAIRFGTVLENVVYDEYRHPLYHDDSKTENTRAAYPLEFIEKSIPEPRAGHPSAIVFLSADATGVLPTVARLQPEDVKRHFLLGYTSKLAGTERGVTAPEPTFSACFAAPFITDSPSRYAQMLMERVQQHQVPVYLLNTGWPGGGIARTGRMPLVSTRAIVDMILSGQLANVEYRRDDDLMMDIPVALDGIKSRYLHPEEGFTDSDAYMEEKTKLVQAFQSRLQTLLPKGTGEWTETGQLASIKA